MTSILASAIICGEAILFMTQPVDQHRPVNSTPQVPPGGPVGSAPAGVAQAPTTISSVGGPTLKEKGYIERAVEWIVVRVKWLFKKIFCCCYKEEEKKPETPPIPPKPKEPEVPKGFLKLETDLKCRYIEFFHALPQERQDVICEEVGQMYKQEDDKARSWWQGKRERKTIGREKIGQNPMLLGFHIKLK